MSVKSASLICLLALVQSTVSARADDIAPKKSREMRVAHATLPVRHSLQLPSPKAFMRIYGQAEAPYGYLRFCSRNAEECRPAGAELERGEATPARLSALDAINRTVNRTIEPATDKELYGEVEYWTLPDARRKGDCEDYALLKRKMLIAQGWPTSALLLTVVRDEVGDGHAVLTVRTHLGDFILDNKTDDIRLWSKTPYKMLMRQSFMNPNVWVSLDPNWPQSPLSIAGVRKRP